MEMKKIDLGKYDWKCLENEMLNFENSKDVIKGLDGKIENCKIRMEKLQKLKDKIHKKISELNNEKTI